jgi:hypothetical protein
MVDTPEVARPPVFAAASGAGIAGRALRGLPSIALISAMTVFLWRLTLFTHRTLVHGDSIVFGLPLFELRARVVAGHASPFWADTIFGGYPPIAESQAGFLAIIPMLMAAIVTPLAGTIFTVNLFRVACMILTGIGTLGLCRSLGLSRPAALFAAVAIMFAPLWLYTQTNPALGSPYLFVPWCLWAMEVWLKRPTIRSAAVMGITVAGCVLAGYPQAAHGTVVYMALSLVPAAFSAAGRREWATTWRMRLATGAFAGVLSLGLSAALLLPLLELVGQSHRSGGVPLQFQIPLGYYLRGMFYTLAGDVRTTMAFPANGSLIVCILASLAPLFSRSPRLIGHFVAAVVLMQLGIGNPSAFFRFVYEHDLLPGMHYFRNTGLYLMQWTVGAAVLAGAAIDGLSRWFDLELHQGRSIVRSARAWGLVAAAIVWGWVLERVHTPGAPLVQFAVVGGAVLGMAALAAIRRPHWAPMLVTALMLVEIVALRLAPFHVASDKLLAEPGSVHAIKALPDWPDYRVIDASAAPAYSFRDSKSPDVNQGVRRMLSAMSGLTPVLWNMRGMDGAFALPLARLIEARPLLYAEIEGKSSAPPGARLLDMLAIRFIAEDDPLPADAIRLFWHEPGAVYVMENTAAKPRFQAYDRHLTAASFDDALAQIRGLKAPTLVIENPPGAGHLAEPDDAPADTAEVEPPFTFDVQEARATYYRFDVRAARPGWLFVADANYPGWQATVDGKPAPLFTAQLLGKAVAIPAGRHLVTIEFHPRSVRIGASISLVTLAIAALALIFGPKMASWARIRGRNRT